MHVAASIPCFWTATTTLQERLAAAERAVHNRSLTAHQAALSYEVRGCSPCISIPDSTLLWQSQVAVCAKGMHALRLQAEARAANARAEEAQARGEAVQKQVDALREQARAAEAALQDEVRGLSVRPLEQ